MADNRPIIVLFGYDSSPFTQNIRLALKLRQIPYTFVLVPSMMPRPILVEYFNLTYRKIPVLAIGSDLYIDTSLIFEVIHSHPAFPASSEHPPLHASAQIRALTRLLSSHYTDRPLFRLTTGLIPQTVWQTTFGVDRARLIGHRLNAEKLGAKIPHNLSALDTYLSILEPLMNGQQGWVLGTDLPSGADISVYYQLDWGEKISRGDGINDLTGGGTRDGSGVGMKAVFNQNRCPNLSGWFARMKHYFDNLPNTERRVERGGIEEVQDLMEKVNAMTQDQTIPLIRTSASNLVSLDNQINMRQGITVSVAPDDTGRDDPTTGTLVAWSNEEIVIVPDTIAGKLPKVAGTRLHFPKVGFVVRATTASSRSKL